MNAPYGTCFLSPLRPVDFHYGSYMFGKFVHLCRRCLPKWTEKNLSPQGRRPFVVDPGPSEYVVRNCRTTFGEAPGRVIVPKSARRGI